MDLSQPTIAQPGKTIQGLSYSRLRQSIFLMQKNLGINDQDIDSFLKPLFPEYDQIGTSANQEREELARHLSRVAVYVRVLASKIGFKEEQIQVLQYAAMMHDIGKALIPNHIVSKPARLTGSEFEIMKKHASFGYQILRNAGRNLFQIGALVAWQHQEKFDGSGYPHGLQGNQIHIYSRLITLVDVFDALSTARCYKKPWKTEQIERYLKNERNGHFDPELADLLLQNLNEFEKIRNTMNSAH